MKKYLLIFLFLGTLAFPFLSHAAISFDAATDGGFASALSLTYSHTVTTATNTILFVNSRNNAGPLDVTAKYAGVSMTLATETVEGSNFVDLFYLLSPASGANNVVITSTSSILIESGAASYSSVAQVAPEVLKNNTVGSASSITTTLTTLTNNDWLFEAVSASSGCQSAGAGTTIRANPAGLSYCNADSNGPITPAGSASLVINGLAGTSWGTSMAAFAPFVAAPASTARRRSVIIQ